MKKSVLAIVVAIGLFLALGGGQALAAFCFVPDKPAGAGVLTNPHGRGGFITEEGVDVFHLPVTPGLEDGGEGVGELPEGAHNAGPGDNECDGKGVDDIEHCP